MDLLPEIASPPRYVPAPEQLLPPQLRAEVDSYLAQRGPPAFLMGLRSRLTLSPSDALVCGAFGGRQGAVCWLSTAVIRWRLLAEHVHTLDGLRPWAVAHLPALLAGTKYNVPLVNALAFYVGIRAVEVRSTAVLLACLPGMANRC